MVGGKGHITPLKIIAGHKGLAGMPASCLVTIGLAAVIQLAVLVRLGGVEGFLAA